MIGTVRSILSLFIIITAALETTSGQVLERRELKIQNCNAVEIRLAAKHANGSPENTLSNADILVRFPYGNARILALDSFTSLRGAAGQTDILFVVPPTIGDASSQTVRSVLSNLADAEMFSFQAAVLRPDGITSEFSSDIKDLSRNLQAAAVSEKHALRSLKPWLAAEEKAFLQLRRLEGRHTVVRLASTDNPHHIAAIETFSRDYSFDSFAAFDITEVYRLLTPVSVSAAIPFGDASTEHVDTAPDTLGVAQSTNIQNASAAQSSVWIAQNYWNTRTAGRAEDNVASLMQDLIRDAASTYDLVVQPEFSCGGAGFWRVDIVSKKPGVKVFAPQAIQMIPFHSRIN